MNAAAARPVSSAAVGVLIALAILVALQLGGGYLTFHNTLQHNGRWDSAKVQLGMPVMGAYAFVMGPQALAGGRLNLHAWHGYQEITSAAPHTIHSMAFDVRLGPEAHVSVIFDKHEGRSFGFRLSTFRQLPSVEFEADRGGRFVRMSPIGHQLAPQRWHHVELVREPDGILLQLDDAPIGRSSHVRAGPHRFGFRGGHRLAQIDNLVVTGPGSSVRDNFANRKSLGPVMARAFSIVLGINALLAALLRLAGAKRQNLAFGLIVLNAILLLTVTMGAQWQRYRGHRYPIVNELMRDHEEYWKGSSGEEVIAALHEAHEEGPDPNVRRILFLGSSQTWGAGAITRAYTFPERLVSLLNDTIDTPRPFVAVNASISGIDSETLVSALEERLVIFNPEVIVINLSHNDQDPAALEGNLGAMVELARNIGALPVFLKEAMNPEVGLGGSRDRHAAMERVAEAKGVPIIDVHEELAARNHLGFLWWDSVHLTSFGHELVARTLAENWRSLTATSP